MFFFSWFQLGSQIAGIFSVGSKGLETIDASQATVSSAEAKDIKIFDLDHENSKLK